MSRQSRREEVKTLLTPYFTDVFEGARRSFGGRSPVAVILSRSYAIQNLTRSLNEGLLIGLSVSIYVRADAGQEDTAEDVLDGLVVTVADTLRDAGYTVGESDAMPGGATLRQFDGQYYRAEIVPLNIEDFD
jgi:hypothetical protein